MNAPPMPISARVAISMSGEPASGRQRRAERRRRAGRRSSACLRPKRSPSAPAVSSSAGEDEHVGVDDPLQLRGTTRRGRLERRQRDVEDRVVEPDDQQREAQDDERPPAAGVGSGGGAGGGGDGGGGHGGSRLGGTGCETGLRRFVSVRRTIDVHVAKRKWLVSICLEALGAWCGLPYGGGRERREAPANPRIEGSRAGTAALTRAWPPGQGVGPPYQRRFQRQRSGAAGHGGARGANEPERPRQ